MAQARWARRCNSAVRGEGLTDVGPVPDEAQITVIDVTPLKARFLAHDPETGQACEVELLKEVLWHPPVLLEPGPVLARDDLVATKVRALADRGLPRDAIDVHALRHDYTIPELENLGARRPDEWDLRELRDYGLTPDTITDLAPGPTDGCATSPPAWAAMTRTTHSRPHDHCDTTGAPADP